MSKQKIEYEPLEKVKRPTLTPRERRINALFACKKHRENLRKKGYKAMQFWVPQELKETIREMVKETITEYETSQAN